MPDETHKPAQPATESIPFSKSIPEVWSWPAPPPDPPATSGTFNTFAPANVPAQLPSAPPSSETTE